MLKLDLGKPHGETHRILCLGAHSDDIEIGAGGAVLTLLEMLPNAHVDWVVLSATPTRECEAQASAAEFLTAAASKDVLLGGFRTSYFPYDGATIKEFFEDLKKLGTPDLILTHYRDDLHQDHALVSKLTWNTFRDHLILEYEIPKYDGDLGRPNAYIPLTTEVAEKKVDAIMRHFASQQQRQWFTEETFQGLMRLRGVECNAPSHFAEAFHLRKACL